MDEKQNKDDFSTSVSMETLTENEYQPTVSENAINAVTAKENEKIAELEKLEAEGVKLKKDGTPAKKRGRKSKNEKNTSDTVANKSQFVNPRAEKQENGQVQENIEEKLKNSQEAAIFVSGILETAQIKLISKDFEYNKLEREANIMAWKDTFDYYGGVELSPPMRLAMSHGSIIMTRSFNSSETRSKFSLMAAWTKNKFTKLFKGRKHALSNTGADASRENDIRKKESESPKKSK